MRASRPSRTVAFAALPAALIAGALLSGTRASAAAPRLPAGGPVPAHTRATSVSFISPSTGFILGTAPCTQAPCSAILRTTDRGASWVGLAAPRESVSAVGGSGLWGLRFATATQGFAWGRGLWQTSDASASWQRVSAPARFIVDLEPVAGRALLAVATNCSGSGRCTAASLYRRAVSGGAWSRVTSLGNGGPGAGPLDGSITVHGATVFALHGTRLLRSTDAGRTFAPLSQPCTRAFIPNSVADSGTHAYLLCVGSPGAGQAPKRIYRLSGRRWVLAGRPPAGGDGSLQLAAGSDRALVISASSGASWLYRSGDGGRRWGTALQRDSGGIPWGDLGFTTPSDGAVIEGPAHSGAGSARYAPGRLWLTQDAGRRWAPVTF